MDTIFLTWKRAFPREKTHVKGHIVLMVHFARVLGKHFRHEMTKLSKLPAVIRQPPVSLQEAKTIAEAVRREEQPWYDFVEVFGASGSLVKGFDAEGLVSAPAFDVRILVIMYDLFFLCKVLAPQMALLHPNWKCLFPSCEAKVARFNKGGTLLFLLVLLPRHSLLAALAAISLAPDAVALAWIRAPELRMLWRMPGPDRHIAKGATGCGVDVGPTAIWRAQQAVNGPGRECQNIFQKENARKIAIFMSEKM